MSTFSAAYNRYRADFERALKAACDSMNYRPAVLTESMRYSLLLGGKRLRPVLFYATTEALGCNYTGEEAIAVALECIHTYSLIHDDLPAMDNDDFRRGKPSNHKKFGEANAILAGDALLTYAAELLLAECLKDERHIRAGQVLMSAAGADGMIAGQSADLLYTGSDADEEVLFRLYAQKTGRLIAAPVQMAAILAQKCEREANAFGEELGILFQLTDDILDETGDNAKMGKTLGKDAKDDKLTCIKLFGLEKSIELADDCAARCLRALGEIDGDTQFLAQLVESVRLRDR